MNRDNMDCAEDKHAGRNGDGGEGGDRGGDGGDGGGDGGGGGGGERTVTAFVPIV